MFRQRRDVFEKILTSPVLSKRNGWYSSQEFHDILKKERNRSDRSGSPLAFILIDLGENSRTQHQISENEYYAFLEKFLNLLTENTRDYDVKSILNNYKIGILLVDTSMDGAKFFVEKLIKVLFNHFDKNDRSDYIRLINSVVISSYPVNQVNNIDSIQGYPVIIRNLSFLNKEYSIKNNLKYEITERKRPYIDWHCVTVTDGIISLTAPFSLEEQLFRPLVLDYQLFKRIMDVVGAIIGIILFSPLMLLIALGIKLTSRGPVLFKQKRIGYRGKCFTFLKFRSMRVDTDETIHQEYVKRLITGDLETINNGTRERPLYKINNDPRVTPFGRFLRKTSLDELPQFFNVLEGAMSLVGPRPPIPYELDVYKNWHYRRVLEVKPGITGLWQVYGRSKTSFDEMVRLDLKYVEQQSLLLDLKIILKTFGAILNSEGAC